MTTQIHFPFPNRKKGISDNQIFYTKSDSEDYVSYCYKKNTTVSAIIIANQYFSIEEILLESFQYVTPIYKNKDTSSARFATIIRESCNLYELLCRKAYDQFFEYNEQNSLNIYNYLSLEHFFRINKDELRTAVFHNYLEEDERIKPFKAMEKWEGDSALTKANIPEWWTAYNKIKHDSENIIKYANLHNAIFSISAIFLLIRKIYGDGLISGFLSKPTNETNITAHLYPIRNSNVFIGEILKSQKR